ncbi:MAG: NYN domain-containing protein [Phototrophicales bacterium]|nr:NYN domain-containing protein [Phototrophicales bacterium]
MSYLIDGHNLIGQLPDMALDDPDDEAKLVQRLIGWVARTRRMCVVVFDAGLPGGTSRMSTSMVRVVFANHTSSADKVIIDRIYKEKHPKNWTVVSSDNGVLDIAKRQGMQMLKSTEFARLLERPVPVRPDIGEAVDVRLSDAEVNEWLKIFGDEK